jgi:hypothetical protein
VQGWLQPWQRCRAGSGFRMFGMRRSDDATPDRLWENGFGGSDRVASWRVHEILHSSVQ